MAWGLVEDIERRGERAKSHFFIFHQKYIPSLNFTLINSSFVSFPFICLNLKICLREMFKPMNEFD